MEESQCVRVCIIDMLQDSGIPGENFRLKKNLKPSRICFWGKRVFKYLVHYSSLGCFGGFSSGDLAFFQSFSEEHIYFIQIVIIHDRGRSGPPSFMNASVPLFRQNLLE